ncbi:MAG: amino acid racemase [Treponema sp.]|jgi:aspartate racemase|nr:amino acid racemase [Treponema sp.]
MENLNGEGAAPLVGVIGGMGPYAGVEFLRKILANTVAIRDQDHISCMLISCPSLIPDRSEFLLGTSADEENPAKGMFLCAQMLYKAGIRYVSVACNTAHSIRIFTPFLNMVKESLPNLTVVNMLETCAAWVKTDCRYRRLGLLATLGTYKSRVYHEYFTEEDGFTLIDPEERGCTNIHEAIYSEDFGIKPHPKPIKRRAKNALIYEAYRLADRGAEAVLIGCTELPLALDQEDIDIPLLDPAIIAARALIYCVAPEKLTPFAL